MHLIFVPIVMQINRLPLTSQCIHDYAENIEADIRPVQKITPWCTDLNFSTCQRKSNNGALNNNHNNRAANNNQTKANPGNPANKEKKNGEEMEFQPLTASSSKQNGAASTKEINAQKVQQCFYTEE